ncbi:MAG TPA: NAD(P)-dependent oxidoreductase, partial [Chondromyces sp.]|nr:NAD(P)-dependent oxidoreductase [Chondromyces sp.]
VRLVVGYHTHVTEPLRIAITGASGFLGRLLVELLRRRHRIVALDRRPLIEAGMADHSSVEWYQLDLTDAPLLRDTFACIRAGGRVDVLIHLAAYYDFTGEEHPEYQRTNIVAMRSLLDASRGLGLEHFIFASSVAACPFSSPGRPITEATPPDGRHIYARTKRAGERMLADFTDSFSPLIVRFAAMFSDWCEYPPLQVMLDTWLSGAWDARILAGRGDSAIPYLHVRDSAFFMMRLLEQRHRLEPLEVLMPGEDGAVSHLELFRAATAHVHGSPRRPIHLPKPLCRPGIWVRDLVGRAIGTRPFERTWMADYVDRRMDIDAGRTRARLGWSPTPRLSLLTRLPFLIEHRRENPLEWYRRNRNALEHLQLTPNFRVYRLLKKYESSIEQEIAAALERRAAAAPTPLMISAEQRFWDHRVTLRNLIAAVQSGENEVFLNWCRDLAERRLAEGFSVDEVVAALKMVDAAVVGALREDPEHAELKTALRDHIDMPIEFGADRVLEVYENAAAFGGERSA